MSRTGIGGTLDGANLDLSFRAIARDAVDNEVTSDPASVANSKREVDQFFDSTGSPKPDAYAASPATSGVVNVGGFIRGNIETTADADWFKITLQAGQTDRFDLQGLASGQGTLQFARLELRDASGNVVASNFAGGLSADGGTDSRLLYTVSSSGTYHLSDPLSSETGTYRISVAGLGSPAQSLWEV